MNFTGQTQAGVLPAKFDLRLGSCSITNPSQVEGRIIDVALESVPRADGGVAGWPGPVAPADQHGGCRHAAGGDAALAGEFHAGRLRGVAARLHRFAGLQLQRARAVDQRHAQALGQRRVREHGLRI